MEIRVIFKLKLWKGYREKPRRYKNKLQTYLIWFNKYPNHLRTTIARDWRGRGISKGKKEIRRGNKKLFRGSYSKNLRIERTYLMASLK